MKATIEDNNGNTNVIEADKSEDNREGKSESLASILSGISDITS